jgi:hypothetical protein
MQKIRMATGALMALLIACVARAASPIPQPPADLGATSFLDGEAGQGLLLEIIGNAYTAGFVTDATGRPLPGHNGQSSDSLTLHTACVSDVPIFGGHLGFEFLLPFAFFGCCAPCDGKEDSMPAAAKCSRSSPCLSISCVDG